MENNGPAGECITLATLLYLYGSRRTESFELNCNDILQFLYSDGKLAVYDMSAIDSLADRKYVCSQGSNRQLCTIPDAFLHALMTDVLPEKKELKYSEKQKLDLMRAKARQNHPRDLFPAQLKRLWYSSFIVPNRNNLFEIIETD